MTFLSPFESLRAGSKTYQSVTVSDQAIMVVAFRGTLSASTLIGHRESMWSSNLLEKRTMVPGHILFHLGQKGRFGTASFASFVIHAQEHVQRVNERALACTRTGEGSHLGRGRLVHAFKYPST